MIQERSPALWVSGEKLKSATVSSSSSCVDDKHTAAEYGRLVAAAAAAAAAPECYQMRGSFSMIRSTTRRGGG